MMSKLHKDHDQHKANEALPGRQQFESFIELLREQEIVPAAPARPLLRAAMHTG